MFVDDRIYEAYLEEMAALENFRASHTTLYRDTPLESLEDPDTLRLVETLAFFSARSRTQGMRKIAHIHQLLFQQYFSYLVNPLPSMGLLELKPSLKIPERVHLPAGTEVIAQTHDGRKATFQTMDALTVTPLFCNHFACFKKIQGGWRIDLRFQSPHVQNEDLKEISFYINHLNNFFGSLRAYFSLCRCIESVEVFYDESDLSNKTGIACSYSFNKPESHRIFNHPLEKIRSELHFPEKDMFLTVQIPPHTKKWQTIAFSIQLSSKWPDQLKPTENFLVPFVVPIVNLKMAKGEPIHCDGTKDDYPILYPNPVDRFSLHSLLGVYEIVPGGMRPLKPGFLDKEGATYEVELVEQKISLDFPKAFQNPRKVSIDALWTQLWFTDYIDQEFKIYLSEKYVSGLSSHLLQRMREHEIALAVKDPKFLLRLLSLKNQTHLNISEILFLMNSLKNIDHSYFRFVPSLILNLKVTQQLDRTGMGPTIRYEFQLKEWDGRNWEIVVLFFKNFNRFLNDWLSNFHVETAVFFPYAKTPLIFIGGRDNELPILARDFFLP